MEESKEEKEPKKAGRRVTYDFEAFEMIKTAQEVRALLNANGMTKKQRNPIVPLMRILEDYLHKKAYTPPSTELERKSAKEEMKAIRNENVVLIKQHEEYIKEKAAEGYSSRDIRKMLHAETNVLLNGASLAAWLGDWTATKEYQKGRIDYMNEITRVRLYSKRARLEEIGRMYSDAYQRYMTSPSSTTMNDCVKLLNQARLEEDGHTRNQITINNTNNVTQTFVTNLIDRQTEIALTKTLPLREIIISRVCLKSGYDPIKFLERLHNNHYASQAGMRGMNQISEKVVYPSQIMMDLDAVSKIAKEGEQVIDVDYEEVETKRTEKVSEEPSKTKNALLERLKHRKQQP